MLSVHLMQTEIINYGQVIFLLTYERDFMLSLSEDNHSDVIEAFNSTSRYLDDLLSIDNKFFDSIVNRILVPSCSFICLFVVC